MSEEAEFLGEIPREFAHSHNGTAYDYAWHGLMAYTESKVRLIGYEPQNPVLMYNLGCNGVGFLPSIYGSRRITRLISGDALDPNVFDPV